MTTEPLEGNAITDLMEFIVNQRYNRWDLHNVFGGQRYSGIATPANYPLIFIFTGDSGEAYGYEDKFLDDDTFLYTGEGTTGDMDFSRGNKAIRDHKENGERLHLFKDTNEAWIVTYVGEYEYVDYKIDQLRDQNGNYRDAIRFFLEPVDTTLSS